MSSLERKALNLLGVRRQFHELNLRWRVFLSQLPLTISVLLALPLVWYVSPDLFSEPHFRTGLILVGILTAAAGAVPWHRLPPPLYWSIPLLDFVAVGFLYDSGRTAVTGLSLLSVFPVFWLAWSEIAPKLAALISFVGPTLVLWTPIFGSPSLNAAALAAPLIVPFIMVAISVTLSVVTLDSSEQQRRLQTAEAQISASWEELRLRTVLLDAVLNTVDVGVLALGPDGEERMRNSRQDQHRELVLPDDGAGHREKDFLLFGPDGVTPLPEDQRPARRAMRGESFSGYLIWAGSGNRQRTLSVSAGPLWDESGAFAGSVLAFADVTELVTALKVKDEFVASVSHELRTPLTSIMGYLDLALEEAEDIDLHGPIRAALQVSLRNAERLLTLVTDLLSTASGAVRIEPAPVDLAGLIADSVEASGPRAEAAGVRLISELDGVPLPLEADASRLGQVLDNLLSNAIKYTPAGGSVRVRAQPTGGGTLLEVEDTGMGMTVKEQAEVFTRFFRTAAVRKKAIPGVGLGLVISKAIVEAHGGQISFSSEPGEGTTFRVWLPTGTRQESGPDAAREAVT